MNLKVKKIIAILLVATCSMFSSVAVFGAQSSIEKYTYGPRGRNTVNFAIYNIGYGNVVQLNMKNVATVNVDYQTINCINIVLKNGGGIMGQSVEAYDSRSISYKSNAYGNFKTASARFEVRSANYGNFSYNLAYSL